MRKLFFVILLFIFCITSSSQETTEQQLENLADITESEIEDDSYLQQYEMLKRYPLNLNIATEEDLQVFRFLNQLQIFNLIQYRKLLGNFVDVHELQSIPTWDVATIKKILPYITVASPFTLSKNFFSKFSGGDHIILMRTSQVLQKAIGYDTTRNTHYSGSRQHLLLRYKYQFKNEMQYGVVADKDPGEQFFKRTQPHGFDFYSAHFFASNLGAIKALALGDFTVNMGQGLIQWQSLAFKKSADAMAIKRQSQLLRPYNSAGEFFFNRGAGITVEKKNLEFTVFSSIKNFSGNIAGDTLTNEEVFTSFQTSGLHRTPSELADKNSIRQTSFGGNITYKKNNFHVGVNAVKYFFSKPLRKRNDAYNLSAIIGNNWGNAGIDYSYTYKNFHFFGETAVDKNFNKATTNGLLLSVDTKVDISILYRNINEKYASVYGNAFTEGVMPTNEKGVYTGVSIKPGSGIRIDAYADIYHSPWLRYRTDAPSYGKDFLLQVNYTPNKQLNIYARYRSEAKEINASDNYNIINYVIIKPRQNLRVHFSYSINRILSLRSRVDMVWYDKKGNNAEQGYLIYTEAVFKPNFKIAGNFRLQYFETDGYNSRLYAYEADVLYSYSIPPFFNQGFRYYANLNYDINKKITLWVRWAQTIYQNKKEVDSGLDQIDSNKKTDLKLQLRFIF